MSGGLFFILTTVPGVKAGYFRANFRSLRPFFSQQIFGDGLRKTIFRYAGLPGPRICNHF